ncbi:MAG: hypothetical protein ACLP7Q_12275 [Isosphaeraceae bacterium]
MERTTMESEPPVIKFYQVDGYTEVEPGLPPWLLRELTVSGRRFTLGGKRGFQTVMEDVRLYDVGPLGKMRILTGLVPRVSESLGQAGYRGTINGRIYNTEESPSWDGFQRADLGTAATLRALEIEPRGQIMVSSASAVFEGIILICRFFRGKIMVVAESRQEMYRLAHRLRRRLDEPVVCITKGFTLTESRIEVGTVGSLDLMLADVVILARANQAVLAKTREDLICLPRQRIYGLRLVPEQESSRRNLLLEGIIGPVLAHVGPIWKRPRTVAVILADWRCRSASCGQFGLEWKRHAIWRNSERNNAIAGIARAMIAGDLVALGEHGIFPDANGEAILVKHASRVAILVESPEHARAIGARLPGWHLVIGQSESSVERPQLTESSPNHAEPTSHIRPDRMIITRVGASWFPMSTLDVLIRADGLPWPMEVPDLLAGTRDGKPSQLLVIDLRDEFDEIALQATRRRIADYQRRRWEVLGGPQILERAVFE